MYQVNAVCSVLSSRYLRGDENNSAFPNNAGAAIHVKKVMLPWGSDPRPVTKAKYAQPLPILATAGHLISSLITASR
jgi:hypothetical protein